MSTLPRSGANVNPPEPHDDPTTDAKASILPSYHSAVNEIIQPDKIQVMTRYFVRRWMPNLGENGTRIVLTLRSLGYYNTKTGEKRDGIEIDLAELAPMVGVSVATIKREFGEQHGKDRKPIPGSLQNPALHQFVKRDRQYWRDPVTNRVLRTANVYRVMMDDPIHPDDLPRLHKILEAREKGAPQPQPSPKAQSEPKMPRAKSSKAQSGSKKDESESKRSHIESQLDESESDCDESAPTLKNSRCIPERTTEIQQQTAPDVLPETSPDVVDSSANSQGKDEDDASGVSASGTGPAPAADDPAPEPAQAEAVQETAEKHRRLVAEMVAYNMSASVAEELAAKWPDECRRQLNFMPNQGEEKLENPAGFLRRAIEKCYGAPAGWKKHQEQLAEAAAARKKQDDFNRGFDAKEAAKVKAAAHDKAVAEAMLGRLSQAEKESLERAARAKNKPKNKDTVSDAMMNAGRQFLLLAQFNALPDSERQAIEEGIKPTVST